MKLLFAIIILIGCGSTEHTTTTRTVVKSEPCTVNQSDVNATISCPDGSSATISNGSSATSIPGPSGATGADGKPGDSCSIQSTDTGADITCSGKLVSISNGIDGADGKDGEAGAPGEPGVGVPGTDGVSCRVEQLPSGAQIICGDSVATVSDGAAGVDGRDGADANVPVPPVQIPLPSNIIYFYGFVCNTIPVLGTDAVRFLTYGNKVYILSSTLQTIWSSGRKYCKVSTTGVSYVP
jgi:hypothetical protein